MRLRARAAFATTPFLKRFHKAETGVNYVSNGLVDNSPVAIAASESELLWDGASSDILLSIGTGLSLQETDDSLHRRFSSINITRARTFRTDMTDAHTKNVVNTRVHIDRDALPLDKAWSQFMHKLGRGSDSVGDDSTRVRLNPVLKTALPDFDDIKSIEALQRATEEVIQQDTGMIKETAHRLVASSFYFERDYASIQQTPAGFTCTGSIFCRFNASSRELKALGQFLKTCFRGGFEPYFLIGDDAAQSVTEKVHFSEPLVNDMHLRGYFNIDPFLVTVSKELSTTIISLALQSEPYASGAASLPISGFPRHLISSGKRPEGMYQQTPETFRTLRG